MGCGDRAATVPPGSPHTLSAPPPAPASLIRLARGGGVVRAYDGRTLDLLPWATLDRLGPLSSVVGPDLEQRSVYALDEKRTLVSVELATRRGRPVLGGVADASVGPDGAVVAIDTALGITVVSRRGATRFRSHLPRPARTLAGTLGGTLVAVLGGEPAMVTASDVAPLTTTPVAGGGAALTMYGDLLAIAADSGVALYETGGRRPPRFWAYPGHVTAVAFSPSGHRIYVGRADRELLAVDRFTGETVAELELPDPVAALRGDAAGNWLLARPAGKDSVWVIDASKLTLVGAIATEWGPDLPQVTVRSTVVVRYAGDAVAVEVSGPALREVGRVRNAASDFWVAVRWAPIEVTVARDTATADSTAPVAADTARPASPGLAIYLQVSSSRNPEWATGLVQRLKDASLPAKVLPPLTPDELYRVVLGPYPNREDAETAGKSIGMPSFVITAPAEPAARPPAPRH